MSRTVWVDDREPARVQDVVASVFGEENTTVKRMKSGDIVAPGVQAAAERKEISDFLNSIGDKRIWKQTKEMERQYDYNCIVVEGSHIESFVADIYGGHAAAVKKVLGVCAWLNLQPNWSAFWVQPDGDEGTKLLSYYLVSWFRQVDKAQKSE